MPEGKPTAYVLVGPTASGKSRWAHEVALRNDCEIVSMDSAQVYRGMDVGTAKPSAAERRAVRYHLIDIIDPTESYSAGRFVTEATHAVEEITARGRIPLIVGGTMLYLRALLHGLDPLPQAVQSIRRQIDEDAKQRGWPALHKDLANFDPVTAARIGPKDAQRIQRAIEVFRATGIPLSEHHTRKKPALPFALAIYEMKLEARSDLHRRIEERFDRMLNAGLVEELRALREQYELDARLPSMRAVGYRQAWRFLDKEISAQELRESGIAATRQLAKRQLTWLRRMPDFMTAEWLPNAIQGR